MKPSKGQRPVERPVRIGVFQDVAAADAAIVRLLNAGFTRDEITVIAPKSVLDHFEGVRHQPPAGSRAVIGGGTVAAAGAMLGGILAAATVIATGGGALVVAGPIIASAAGGAFAGGFIGAMMMRGFEKEVAHFYDQAIKDGKILVGVDLEHRAEPREPLELAEHVLAEAGSAPLPLREG
jgi:hypothetical protein